MLKRISDSLSLILETAKIEWRLIFKDDAVKEIYILFVALVYFFYTFVYSPEIFTNLPVAFVDNDQTTESHQIRRMLNDTESLDIAYDVNSMAEAKKLFEDEKVSGIIVIPEKFSQDLQKSGGNPSIAIYCDASYMLYYDKTLLAVTNALGAFTGEIQLKQTMMSGVPMKEAIASSKPFNIISTPLYNLDEGYAIFIIPLVIIVALQTLQLTGMGVLYGTLRERNTFITNFAIGRRSRFGYFFMTLGRSLPYLLISMLLLLLGIKVVFHIFTIPQRGDSLEVFVFLIPVVLAITFLGMVLMNIFKNREDTIMLCTVFSIPAVMMGGVSYPIVAFPVWIKVMAFFFPSTIGVKGFLALSQAGASLFEIRDIYYQMWGICLFYFIIAIWTNRRFLYHAEVPSTLLNNSAIVSTMINIDEHLKKAIRSLLMPIKDLVWRFDKTLDTFDSTLSVKLKDIPAAQLQAAPSYISGPVMDAVKYVAQYDDIKNIYANLLANAMDKQAASKVLPSYVEIIKSLSPDEARLLAIFTYNEAIPYVNILQKSTKESKAYSIVLENHTCLAKDHDLSVAYNDNMPLYFGNFIRMGILESPEGFSLEKDRYLEIENCTYLQELKINMEKKGHVFEIQKRFYKLTSYGRSFINIAVKDK